MRPGKKCSLKNTIAGRGRGAGGTKFLILARQSERGKPARQARLRAAPLRTREWPFQKRNNQGVEEAETRPMAGSTAPSSSLLRLRSLTRSMARKRVGMKNRVMSVEVVRPPIRTRAMGA